VRAKYVHNMAGLYQYQQLPSKQAIRLLYLSRSGVSDAIVFELSCVELDSRPEYEAVSYTWGDRTRSNAIKHRETGEMIYVTANCETALNALATSTHRTLWMDAVCIDQNNVDERSQQVKLMAQVFGQATRTIAYIGESDSHSARVSAWCAKQQRTASVSASSSESDTIAPEAETILNDATR
jgi:Heterokaryon incompatibility protein (HET)